VHGFGGVPHNLTLDQCYEACVKDTACVAIDWESSNGGQTCWILTSTVTGVTIANGVITHYDLNRACLGKSYYHYCTQNTYHVDSVNELFSILSFHMYDLLNHYRFILINILILILVLIW